MSLHITTLILLSAALVLCVARAVQTHVSLRHFPGHWSVGWSRIWLLRTQGSGEMHKRFTQANCTHGELTSSSLPLFPVSLPTSGHIFSNFPSQRARDPNTVDVCGCGERR